MKSPTRGIASVAVIGLLCSTAPASAYAPVVGPAYAIRAGVALGVYPACGACVGINCADIDACLSGPAVPYRPGCEDEDVDADADVDQEDCLLCGCMYTAVTGCTPSPPPPTPVSAGSRKTHGSAGPLDIGLMPVQSLNIPMASGSDGGGVENRKGGPTELHVWFVVAIQGVDGLDTSDVHVTDTANSPITVESVEINPNDSTELIINMSGAANATRVTITFPGIQDADGNICEDSLTFGVLKGDVEGSGFVGQSSVAAVLSHVGEPVTQENCKYDVDLSGAIDDSEDVGIVQAMMGTHLPWTTGRFDFNGDGDVDADDLGTFDRCFTGPNVLGPPVSGCTAEQFNRSDQDTDGDVDQVDFAHFQRCYSGEDNPADPNCANSP